MQVLSEIFPFNIQDIGKNKKLISRVMKYERLKDNEIRNISFHNEIWKDQEPSLKDCHMFQESATFQNKFSL